MWEVIWVILICRTRLWFFMVLLLLCWNCAYEISHKLIMKVYKDQVSDNYVQCILIILIPSFISSQIYWQFLICLTLYYFPKIPSSPISAVQVVLDMWPSTRVWSTYRGGGALLKWDFTIRCPLPVLKSMTFEAS